MNIGVTIMKNRIIFIVSLIVLFLCISFVPTKAESITTSSEITVIGAQVRTTGNAGIRFVGEVGNLDKYNISKYGIILAYGETEINNDFVLNGTINDKAVLNAEVSELTNKGQFFITLYNIPESEYSQEVTARAYVVTNNEEVIYSDSVTDRSLEDVVVLAYMDNDRSEFVSKVFDKIQEKNLNDYVFEINGENATITDYTGSAKHLVIPSTVTIDEVEYTVDTIGRTAFNGRFSLESVTIQSGVTSIESSSFCDCISLINITIPSSVTSIDYWAFSNCDSLTNVYYNGTIEDWCNIEFNYGEANPMFHAEHFYMLDENEEYQEVTEINIPNTVTSIEFGQFCGFDNVTSILISEKVASIGDDAFFDCTSLTSITIPESVESIGERAFAGCTSLANITIPSSIISSGDSAFNECDSLTNVYYNGTIEDWCNITFNYGYSNPLAFTENFYMLDENDEYQEVTEIEIPNTISSLSFHFYQFKNLKSIIIPSSVTSIGIGTFYNCSSLTSIEIPSSVESMGDYAFYGCSSITSIEIPSSVESIGKSAFYECTSLETLTIQEGVTSIGDYTFYGCSNLTSIEIPSSVESIGYGAFALCANLTSATVSANVIGDFVFFECTSLETLTITNDVTSIGIAAFSKCTSLEALTIQEGIISIGEDAFSYCSSLTSIEIPSSVITIDTFAFFGCIGLTSIEIPSSVTSIGDGVFGECSILTSIVVDENNTTYDSRNNCNAIIETDTNNLLVGCKNTIIPNTITNILSCAFYGCTGLTSIEIPSSVTSIGDNVFCECSNLTNVVILGDVTTIDAYAFEKCTSLESIVIPISVTTIGEYAFLDCSLLTIYCEAESQPSGWDVNWNSSNCPIVWGYTQE